jgi:hypothetical protein
MDERDEDMVFANKVTAGEVELNQGPCSGTSTQTKGTAEEKGWTFTAKFSAVFTWRQINTSR